MRGEGEEDSRTRQGRWISKQGLGDECFGVSAGYSGMESMDPTLIAVTSTVTRTGSMRD